MKKKNIKKKLKGIKKKLKKYKWVGILTVSIFATMYIYGMAKIYFPDPIHLGAGQYLDIAAGVIILCLLLTGAMIAIIFKKKKKGDKK